MDKQDREKIDAKLCEPVAKIKLTIDGQDVEVSKGATVLQAIETAGIEIPVFCYHPRLKIAGNCRACLVEIEGGPPKPSASCALPATEGMKVKTTSEMVRKAREGVLEFLLINHPLDCPICDQGGECDLQDITLAYGRGQSEFQENKRAVPEKFMGPLVKTVMTRCIHCTRCVRFAEEIAGTPELGGIFRGEKTEITTYQDQPLTSELSGNLVDLCPVGALTSRPYAFRGRPWELSKTSSIDVLDAVGSNIRIDSHENVVKRILPRLNEEINEEWISDKTRHAPCDGLLSQRLDRPYKREKGKLVPCSWEEAFALIRDKMAPLKAEEIAAFAGDLVDVESLFALKEMMGKKGVTYLDCRQDNAYLETTYRASYLFNTTIAGIEQADVCLLIGGHPRYEAPLINARLRKRFLKGGFKVFRLGGDYKPRQGPTFPTEELGDRLSLLEALVEGTHPLSKILASAEAPMLILSQEVLTRPEGAVVLNLAHALTEKYPFRTETWNGFNVLHRAAGRVGGLDIGFVPSDPTMTIEKMLLKAQKGEVKALYLLGADEINFDLLRGSGTFVVYQGHHGDRGAHHADVILPGVAYTEKEGIYVNTEGRAQRASKAVNPPGDAQEDWKILCTLAQVLGVPLPYETLDTLREHLFAQVPFLKEQGLAPEKAWGPLGHSGQVSNEKLPTWESSFYMTDVISRHSRTMAACQSTLDAVASQRQGGQGYA